MVVRQERFERGAVGGHAVGPVVVAHQLPGGGQQFLEERQRGLGRGRIREPLQRDRLGRVEGLVDGYRQPAVALHQFASDHPAGAC